MITPPKSLHRHRLFYIVIDRVTVT